MRFDLYVMGFAFVKGVVVDWMVEIEYEQA